MLFNEVNEFNSIIRTGSPDDTVFSGGVTVTASATPHVKGTPVTLLAGAAVTEDVFGIYIQIGTGISAASQRECLIDILIDPAGGTSWANFIDNLFSANASSGMMDGATFYFPVFIKAGTSIGAQMQCNAGSFATSVCLILWGKPSHPHLVNVGSKVETIGADTANSRGTAVTVGTLPALGAYASLGVTGQDNWYWQAGVGIGDASSGSSSFIYQFELSAGDATNKKLCIPVRTHLQDSSERGGASNWAGVGYPVRKVPAGQTVYARVAGGTETNPSAVAYGVR